MLSDTIIKCLIPDKVIDFNKSSVIPSTVSLMINASYLWFFKWCAAWSLTWPATNNLLSNSNLFAFSVASWMLTLLSSIATILFSSCNSIIPEPQPIDNTSSFLSNKEAICLVFSSSISGLRIISERTEILKSLYCACVWP